MAQSATGAHALSDRTGRSTRDDDHRHGMTPAQWYCLLGGAALLIGGLAGFLVDANFDTGGSSDGDAGGNGNGMLQGDGLLGFEVNGWHNIVHLLSGLVLLAAFRKNRTAWRVALAFGVVYGIVTLIGLIDGNDVLGIIPVNPADNILHLGLSALGIISGLISRHLHDHDHDHAVAGTTGTARTVERDSRVDRVERTERPVGEVTDRHTERGSLEREVDRDENTSIRDDRRL